jgi:hypothetical protein
VKLTRQLWYILTPQGAFQLCAMGLGAFFEAVSIGVIPFIAVLKEPDLLFKAEPLRPPGRFTAIRRFW